MAEKKVVVEVDVQDGKAKQKAMMAVSSLSGINSISMDMKAKKMTVIGVMDPVDVVGKLRKQWHTKVVSVGPKEEPKKEGEKKEEPKKEGEKKEEPKKETADQIAELVKIYKSYNPQMTTQYVVYSREEDPNACVIC